ncbi:MAG: hydrogenase expression/formation protein HypE [Phycisphaerales bacterium]|nr:hydrogenase expression/formation protein HypE [Phycisphaerales bacterium]
MRTKLAGKIEAGEKISIAHGGGGEMMHRLIEGHILPRLGNRFLNALNDSAIFEPTNKRTAFTTDAFVVQPLEFPGGDIGRLAMCGTINDLAVMGATPTALSLALVVEEGLPLSVLDRILDSIAETAATANVVVATGDTKVIERRSGDGLMITTAGIGHLRDGVNMDLGRVNAGDVVIVSGRIAEHGLAVLSVREGLSFETQIVSDAAPLNDLVATILDSGADVKFMRDPTRGGLAGVLADAADVSNLSIEVREDSIPVSSAVRHTAEVFGLDPLTVANEGKLVAICSAKDADRVLNACRAHPLGKHAALIGHFVDEQPQLVELITLAGGRRVIQRPYGEELPRIC